MKFDQLIEYSMRNIFLEKSHQKCGGETIPGPFSKISKLSISLDQLVLSLIQFVFIVCQVEDYRNILKLSCRQLAFTSYKAFFKNKKESGIWQSGEIYIVILCSPGCDVTSFEINLLFLIKPFFLYDQKVKTKI